MRSLLFITLVIGLSVASPKLKRQLGLFNVVSFDNLACSSSDTRATTGTCYSKDECEKAGGTPNGNCAAGFGVCCVFTSNANPAMISRNMTFFRNPGFPNAYTATDNVVATLTYNSDICQIRLDFETLVLSEPTDGQCFNGAAATRSDQIIVTSPTGINPPGAGGLCGDNLSGQHMYIDTGRTGSVTVTLNVGGIATTTRMWNIKTTFLECNHPLIAPEGCVQYYTGATGSISNFNRPGEQVIAGHNYRSCIRQEAGYCAIAYSAPGDNDFLLMAAIAITSQVLDAAGTDCANTALTITNTVDTAIVQMGNANSATQLCGGKLSLGSLATLSSVIESRTTPFEIHTRTAAAALTTGLKGYNLQYNQIPCQ